MNLGTEFRWDDGLAGPARRIAELNHTPIRVRVGPERGKTFAPMRFRQEPCMPSASVCWGGPRFSKPPVVSWDRS